MIPKIGIFGIKQCGGEKVARKFPKVLNSAEVDQLHRYFNNSNNKRAATNARDYCIIILMLEYGLRVQEVCDLRRDDVDMVTGRLQVRGKGKKDRILYLAPKHLRILSQWLEERPESEWLFCSLHGSRGIPGRQLDQRQVRAKIKQIGRRIGRSDLYPHLLRHTFATRLYDYTRDLARVQEVLGHADVSTTRIYAHISGADVRDTLLEFHR